MIRNVMILLLAVLASGLASPTSSLSNTHVAAQPSAFVLTPSPEGPAQPEGSFDDWWQKVVLNQSTGNFGTAGSNPHGNGSSMYEYGSVVYISGYGGYVLDLSAGSGYIRYYGIDLTGYTGADSVIVKWDSRGRHATGSYQYVSVNGYAWADPNPTDSTQWLTWRWSIPTSNFNWGNASNWVSVGSQGKSTTDLCWRSTEVWVYGATGGALPGPFSLSYPANGATNCPLSDSLRWGSSSGAVGYDVYFGTYSPPPYNGSTARTAYAYSGLSNNTTYYWDVVAYNGSGTTPSSNGPFHFTTLQPPLPGPFDLISPSNGATNQSSSGMLSWGSSSGATSYDVYWGTSSPPQYKENVSGTSTSYSGSPGQTYYWYVVAKNGAGSTECNARFWYSTSDNPVPGPFNLTSPFNGATGQSTSGTLTWQTSSGATDYYVHLGTSNPPGQVGTVSGTSYGYSGLSNDQLYYWDVVAHNGNGTTPSTNGPFHFTTAGGGGTDSIGMGADAWSYTGLSKISFYNYQTDAWDTISTWGPAQNWNWYRFPAAAYSPYKNPSGPRGGVAYTCSGSSDTFKIAYVDFWWRPSGGDWTYDEINGTDYHQVSGNHRTEGTTLIIWGTLYGIPSEARYGEIPVGIGEGPSTPPAKREFTVSCSPNPGNGRADLSYNLTRESRVRLVLYDRAGRSVRQFADGRQRPGSHTVSCDLADLVCGIYVCRLEAEGRSASTAIVKSE